MPDAPIALCVQVEAPAVGPRLSYVLEVVCDWFGWSLELPHGDPRRKGQEFTATLRYDAAPPQEVLSPGTVDVRACGLLDAPVGSTDFVPQWSQVFGQDCPCGLDALGGIFYALSLYPEYGLSVRDHHGRIPAQAHPFVLRGVGHKPLADALALALATRLWRAAGLLGVPRFRHDRAACSIDVDAPTAIIGKPWWRRQSSLLRGVLHAGHYEDAPDPLTFRQLRRWSAGRPDPFNTFDYIREQAESRSLQQDYFTLTGYGTSLDPGWSKDNERWAPFWRKLQAYGRVGIHPSYESSERPELFGEEIARLSQGLGAPVLISRQHFLRVRLPDTFRILLELGIREDHSLMWADELGFRTGSSRSYLWYDLLAERVTPLLLVPPHGMDVTARRYGGLSPKQAVQEFTALHEQAQQYGSGLRCIWHNSNLGPWYGWSPWRPVFETALDLAASTVATNRLRKMS